MKSENFRYLDIDILRGIAVIGMIAAGNPGVKSHQLPWLKHVPWEGFTFADFVYPLFLFVAGLSIAARPISHLRYTTVVKGFAKRSARLFILGLFLLSVSYSTPRFTTGTLQCIAVITFLSCLFHRVPPRQLFVISGAIIAVYGLILQLDPFPFQKGTTLPERIDLLFLKKFRAEEGVLPTLILPSLVLLGMGVQATRWRSRLLFWICALIGLLLWVFPQNSFLPVVPRITSPGALLLSASLCYICFTLAGKYQTVRALSLFALVGKNAIAIYVGVRLFRKWILDTWQIDGETLRVRIVNAFTSLTGPSAGSVLYTFSLIILVLLVAHALDRRKIFIKI